MAERRHRIARLIASISCALALGISALVLLGQESPTPVAAAKSVGTIKSINGKTITLTTDTGSDITVLLQDGARLLRVEPGQKDLKDAAALDLQDLQPGDRILVRGTTAADGESLLAMSLIAMKKLDIAEKKAHEREEWQKHGVGGLVSAVDPANGSITIASNALGANKSVLIHTSKNTILRRYAPDSVKFDDAKVAPLGEIKVGDQLRARGTPSSEATEYTAEEIVSGSFRNVAGTISSVDSSASTITVFDLATKKPVTVKITAESQLRNLPVPVAQRIAARLRGASGDTPAPGGAQRSGEPSATKNVSDTTSAGRHDSQQAPADLQQVISRTPPASLGDLSKGDAVMIVATSGTREGEAMAITLLAGVEPILQASPRAQSILSPWSLGSAGGEGATP
jgi:hypothetical protein